MGRVLEPRSLQTSSKGCKADWTSAIMSGAELQAVAGFSNTDSAYHHPVVPGEKLDIWVPESALVWKLRASTLKGTGILYGKREQQGEPSRHSDIQMKAGPCVQSGPTTLWSTALLFAKLNGNIRERERMACTKEQCELKIMKVINAINYVSWHKQK